MKNLIISMAAVFFLAAVGGPVWADDSAPAKTPTTKTMKHKMVKHKKKKAQKGKKVAKADATPNTKP